MTQENKLKELANYWANEAQLGDSSLPHNRHFTIEYAKEIGKSILDLIDRIERVEEKLGIRVVEFTVKIPD